MNMDWVIDINSLTADLLRPDLTIFIDVPVDICSKRLSRGRSSAELYEDEENLNNVRKKYFEAFDKLKGQEKIFITDGNRPTDMIARDIWEEVFKKTKMENSLR
jgi:dTMP kinase